GAAGAAAADDEVQTLSGSVRRAPSGPPGTPGTPGTPGCAAAAKGPGAQQPKPASLGRGRGAAAAILSLGNVLNYLDRYTVAGVLLDIQQQFGVKDRGAGLLQSVFICSFMVAAPIFGYLGDRFNRKVILSCGVFFWSAVTFSSSFIPRQHFWLLVLSRGLVGVGEASYSTIAPTVIGDLFAKNTRTLMLSVFYFAIPLGSGLGYITGSSVKQAAGDWRWALRVSPIVGMITGTLILILVPATKRGHADQLGGQLKVRTSWLRDMKALIRKGPDGCPVSPGQVCIFVGETLLFSNWAITADILMYVVIPTRRATAVALQSFTSHLLGDAGSPYLIGFISDLIRQSTKDSPLWEFLSLGYALMLCPFVVVLGGMFFLATALFFLGDRAKAEQQALPPSPGADEVPARHVRPAGPRDAMRQSSARARPQLTRHLDPRPSLPQGEPAGDATRTRQSLRPCPQDGEETVPSPYLGGVPGHPGPAGLTRSFLCDPRLGTHPLWCGPAEWPWHQEAASSTDVEGCVWGSRTDGQTPSRWGPGRTQPPARVWGEPGASSPYMVLGGWTFPRDSFGDPGLHREGAAQASGQSFRL
ncbi:sphingosine-1-phosphate transporter SPNS2, partial [Herpailurus yagouaroundi]|uniref:sphingosine-1-phosphate transporter SPNS2 n=1 Tax=Herpailurus yagouaroundi TaxID=1608482 RepID=UPI001AD6AF01